MGRVAARIERSSIIVIVLRTIRAGTGAPTKWVGPYNVPTSTLILKYLLSNVLIVLSGFPFTFSTYLNIRFSASPIPNLANKGKVLYRSSEADSILRDSTQRTRQHAAIQLPLIYGLKLLGFFKLRPVICLSLKQGDTNRQTKSLGI